MAHSDKRTGAGYLRMGVEPTVDFIVMYLVMYTMIATLAHFHFNLNNIYMTLMMLAPMAAIMLVSMRAMFPSARANLAICAGAVVVFSLSFVGMRMQAGVGNAEFLRSMIPHHSGAILMCQRASLTDPDILALCRNIVASQEKEIAEMQQMLKRY